MVRPIKILNRRAVPPGTVVIEQGTPGEQAFLIESGKVEILVKHENGSISKIAEVGPGELIGEMALISRELRSASVRTVETSVLVAISAHDLQEAMQTSEKTYKKLMRIVMDRMLETQRKLMRQELSDVEKTLQSAVEKAVRNIPEAQKVEFTASVQPLLGRMKSLLKRFGGE